MQEHIKRQRLETAPLLYFQVDTSHDQIPEYHCLFYSNFYIMGIKLKQKRKHVRLILIVDLFY